MRTLLVLAILLVLAGCSKQNEQIPGYVEGDFRYISANFPGILQTLAVTRGTEIQSQQLLFILESQPESDLLKQAQAAFDLAKVTLQRRENLLRKGSVTQEEVDQARAQYQQALAKLTQMQWSQAQKKIYSPTDAFVFDTYFLPGELVPAGQPIVSLLTTKDIYIIFYVPEPQLSQLKLGQLIYINCDNCKNRLSAKISYISPKAEYTSPIVYTEKIKPTLVYRVEALPTSLTEAGKLHPGQPLEIDLK